jgi:FkbM family methyltransferase
MARKKPPLALRAARLMRGLGARSGSRACYLLLRKELAPQTGGASRHLRIPGAPHPIWLRAATSDFDVMEQIFVRREYDFTEWPAHHAAIDTAYADCLSEGKVPIIVDCGANIGCASIWFALQYPEAVIYAVEPEPRNFAMLSRNVVDYRNIVPIQAAISDRTARVSLHNPTDEPWACQTEEDANGSIAAVTISNLLAQRPNGAPLIVKIDIEGHETALFRSNTAWAQSAPLVVFEMHDWLFHWRGTGDAMFRCLTRRRRDYLVRGENIFAFAHPRSVRAVMAPDDHTAADARMVPVARGHAR